MDSKGEIEIRISGKKGVLPLSPETYDIRELRDLLEHIEGLLFPSRKKDRPVVSYTVEAGSVLHRFRTTLQYVIGFGAVLSQVAVHKNIDFLDLPTAKAIEYLQKTALQHQYVIQVRAGETLEAQLEITPETRFYRTEAFWADAEFYFYGKVTDAGGKEKANIHINTEDLGVVHIQTPIPVLEAEEKNLLYKVIGVRARGRQNLQTGEIDRGSLVFDDWVDYSPRYDEAYLDALIAKAAPSWKGVSNKDAWLHKTRGNYEG